MRKREEHSLIIAQETISSLLLQLQSKDSQLRKYQDIVQNHRAESENERENDQREISRLREILNITNDEKMERIRTEKTNVVSTIVIQSPIQEESSLIFTMQDMVFFCIFFNIYPK